MHLHKCTENYLERFQRQSQAASLTRPDCQGNRTCPRNNPFSSCSYRCLAMCKGSTREVASSQAEKNNQGFKQLRRELQSINAYFGNILVAWGFQQIQGTGLQQDRQCPVKQPLPTRRTWWTILGNFSLSEKVRFDCSRARDLHHDSMDKLVLAILASSIILIGSVAAIYTIGNSQHNDQNTNELAARVVPMNDWHLKGSAARKDMQTYFDRQNFKAEAHHFEHFVNSHPFFGEGNMYDLSQEIRLPKNLPFHVAGIPNANQKPLYHQNSAVRHLVRLHPVVGNGRKINHVSRVALIRSA